MKIVALARAFPGRTLRVLAVLAVLSIAAWAPARAQEPMSSEPPAVGEAAPTLSLEDLDGTVHTLAEATGEGPVVLVFFRGVW